MNDVDARILGRLLIGVNAIGLAVGLAGLVHPLGWTSAAFAVGVGFGAYLGYVVASGWPRWSGNIFVFALVAGLVELWADHWLVHGVRTLVYPPTGPFVADSPLYMPLAWAGMLASHLALARALLRRIPHSLAAIAIALSCGLHLPIYEWLAHASGWWHYRDARMLVGDVPMFIAVGELAIGVPLPAIAHRLANGSKREAAGLGVAMGLWIFAAYTWAWAWCGT